MLRGSPETSTPPSALSLGAPSSEQPVRQALPVPTFQMGKLRLIHDLASKAHTSAHPITYPMGPGAQLRPSWSSTSLWPRAT